MKRMIERRILACPLLLAAILVAPGCASPAAIALDSRFPDNVPERTAAVVRSLPAPSPVAGPDNALGRPLIAALSHGDEPELIVHDIGSGETLWRRTLTPESRPQLLGDLVVTAVGRQLLAFALATGEPAWRSPIECELYLGAARWRQIVVHSCTEAAFGPGRSRSLLTALQARTGQRLWQRSIDGRVGRPEAATAMLFVPWDLQYLTVLDARTGAEMARLRSSDDVISWVKADARGVFFGHDSVYRLGERGYAGSGTGVPRLIPRLPEIPWLSSLRESAYTFKLAKRSAQGRIGLLFEPVADGSDAIRIADDRFYLLFFRYVFAFNAEGILVWSRLLDCEAIAGQPVSGGLLVVMESGRVELLAAADGRTLQQLRLPAPLASVEIDVEGVAPARSAMPVRPEPDQAKLQSELVRIAFHPDNRLLAARIFSAQQLALLSAPEVTRDLIDLYEHGPLPAALKEAIAAALSRRSSGRDYLLDALDRHYDFLRGTRTPPLALLVPALVHTREQRAVPWLVNPLFEPETPLEVLPQLVSAIDVLGDRMVAGLLLDFLSRYRADSAFSGSTEALERAARAVLRRGDLRYRQRLRSISERADTHATLARSIEVELRDSEQERTDGGPPLPVARETIPERLDQRAVDAVFARHVDAIRACVAEELARNRRLPAVRITFVLEREGRARDLSFSPASPGLIECLGPAIKRYRFPRIRSARQLASYTVILRSRAKKPGEPGASSRKPSPVPEQWWASSIPAEANGEQVAPDPGRQPWWFAALPAPAEPDRSQQMREAEAEPDRSQQMRQAEAGEISPGPSPKAKQQPEPPAVAPPFEQSSEKPWWAPATP